MTKFTEPHMTNQQHPITPPPELVQQWFLGAKAMPVDQWVTDVATQAARWGADQELEACVEWLQDPDLNVDTYKLKAARRPKPPSLKEQALEAQQRMWDGKSTHADWELVRRALEALPND